MHASGRILREMVDRLNERAGCPLGNEIAGCDVRDPTNPLFPKHHGDIGSVKAYEELKAKYPDRFQTT